MKKIIFLMILLLFITACASTNQDGFTKATPKGLDINILQPTEKGVWEGVGFSPLLTVENNADCDISGGNLRVRDLLSDDRNAVKENSPLDLNTGEKETKVFSESMYGDVSTDFTDLNVNFLAEAEYSCSLHLEPQICARSFFADDEGEVLCKERETITRGLMSAPITITSIRKELIWPGSASVSLDLKIHLEKMSKGNLVGDLNINLNFGSGVVSCRDLNDFKWESGVTEKDINCEILLNDIEDIIVDNLLIDLEYDYKQVESISFPVKNNENL